MRLTDAQIERYSRQILLREVGGTGQTALLAARVLITGGGAAFDTATTYLAGAGVGTLDLLSGPASSASGLLAFAPAAARNVEIRVRRFDDPVAITLDDYDVVLVLADRTATGPLPPRGRATCGSVVLHEDAAARLSLAVVPARHGCVACVGPGREETIRPATTRCEMTSHASAGALAALAACRWILGLERAEEPRRLALGDDDATWVDEPLSSRPPCPRGCPPRTQPV